jgi:hypothetical protein
MDQSQVIDSNSDGFNDLIKIKLIFESDAINIKNIKFLVFLNYVLQKKVRLVMQGMCTIDIDTPSGASYVYINGKINLNQKSPISTGSVSKTLYNSDIFQNTSSPFDYASIYKDFSSRNLTINYAYDKIVMPYKSNSQTEVDIEIIIPSYQEIM